MNTSKRGLIGMCAAAVLAAGAIGVARAGDKPYMYRLASLQTTAKGLYFDTGYDNSPDYDWEYVLDAQLSGDYGGVNGRMQFQAVWGSGEHHTWYVLCTKGGNETVCLDSKESTPVYTKSWGGNYANQDILILALGGQPSNKQYGTVYSFQLLRDGELVRDMYPVQIDDTSYGLYDRVSKTVIRASGSGTFIPGAVVADEDEPGEQDDTDVPALGTIYEPAANPNATVSFRWRLASAGVGCDSADIYAAWGFSPDALTRTNLLVAACAPSVVTNGVLTGLPPESAIYVQLFATNASGTSEPSKTMTVTTSPRLPEETFDFGSRSIAIAESGETSVTLRFSPGEEGVSHRLFALYGAGAGGEVRSAWDHVEDLGEISSDVGEYVFPLPDGWGESVLALRFAFDLADEDDLPYTDTLESVAAFDGQYVDTGIVGQCGETGGIEAVADMVWSTVPQDGCFLGANSQNERCYLVYSYPGKWNLGFGPNNDNDGIAVKAGVRYKVEATFHGGEQKIVVNGSPVVTRDYAGPIVSGSLYLFQNNMNGSPQYGCNAQLYALAISEDGVLRRKFVPCLADGVAALFECVERKVYKSEKAGAPFSGGASLGLRQFVPFSTTVTWREDTMPLFDHVDRTADEGTWATVGGALAAFGGAREDCRVRLYLAEGLLTDGLAQVGEDVTPDGDGAFEFRVESLKGGTTYTWLVEAEGTSGEKVRSAPKSFTTRSTSQLGGVSASVVRSTVTVNGMMTERGVGPTTVILRMGTNADDALPKDQTVLTDDTGAFTLVWRGYLDGCDWDVPQYWEVLAVNSDGTRAWTNVFGKATVELEDDTTYTWTGAGTVNADGSRDWGDAANWSPTSASDERVGHPATRQARVVFPADTVAKVRFDAARRVLSMELRDRAALTVTGADTARHSVGSLSVGADVQLTLDGASMRIESKVTPAAAFDFTLDHGASLECGSIIFLTGADRKRMTLRDGSTYTSYGANNGVAMGGAGEVVVDDSTLACNVYFDAYTGGGKLVLQGKAPYVKMNGDFRGWNEAAVDPGRGVVEFVIPEGGYAEAPISGLAVIAGDSDKEHVHELTFRVNPKSPGRKAAKAYVQPLVRASTINLDRVVLDVRGIRGGDWRFVPEGSSTPTGIDYLVPARSGLVFVFR